MKYSIIITSYNSSKYITKCLDSIINQTLQNFKVLVIDDGSTDNTKDIIASYQKKYKNIEYYYKKNGGVSDARNYGASKVKTPYFLYVDSDDYVPIDLIETVDKYSDYDVLSFKGIKVDDKGNFIETLEKEDFNLLDGRSYLKSLMNNNSFFLVPWGYVYKTKFWKKHKFEYSKDYVLEDTSLTPIIIMNAEDLISLDYYGYYYVQTNESITRTRSGEKIKFNTKCALYHYDYLIDYVENRDYSKSFNTLFFHFFAHYLIWYGGTLPDNHLKEYAKELRKRKVYDRLRNQYLSDKKERAICRFSYRLYMFKSKTFKWKLESIYFKYERIFNKFLSYIKPIFPFIYWHIIHPIYWAVYIFFNKIYWHVIHKVYIAISIFVKFIYYNIINKAYWFMHRIISKIYWSTRSAIINLFWKIKPFFTDVPIKIYWGTRSIISKTYWGIKSFITNTSIKIFWSVKSFITTNSIKIYWAFINLCNFVFWKIIHKLYWKIRGFASFILRKLHIIR